MINQISKEIHEINKSKGFWDERHPNIAEKLMLIVSELSEAVEADRKDHYADTQPINEMVVSGYSWQDSKFSFTAAFEKDIKNSFEDELADVAIRLFDLAHYKGIDLEWHIRQKMEYNKLRPYKHDKKY